MSRDGLSITRRKLLGYSGALALTAPLAACNIGGTRTPPPTPAATTEPIAPAEPASEAGDVIGSGSVRVALLLPQSAPGNGGATARAFRNAAELAMRDFPNAGIQLAIYDSGGTAEAADAAAGAALAEGAELILGPLFSGEVAAVAPRARAAGVPVVAFSSDASVAGSGVYLLSFLPVDDVRRIVGYSAQSGRRAFAALLPDSPYGSVVEAALSQAAPASGGRIVAIQRYLPDAADIQAKTAGLAASASQFDALLIPDGSEAVATIAASLAAAGVSGGSVQLLGSGQWDDPRILNNPALAGAWFPAPSRQGFESFSGRYRTAFGGEPPRNATLAYDATVLAAGLVRQFGPARFSREVMSNANGFAGMDGIFRFLPNGATERRLAVYEVTGTGSRILDPAPRTFAAST